jgi:NodT family efflux transporter outer membrane factor (OMF) lipoprotein
MNHHCYAFGGKRLSQGIGVIRTFTFIDSAARVRACAASRWIALTGVLALAACNLGPRYRHPDIPPPPAWRADEVSGEATWPSADWWRGFSSPQLDTLIDEAQHTNDDIAAAIARVREADAQARIAGAPLLPAISGTASATRERELNLATPGTTTANDFSPLLNASYELDFWGKNRAAYNAARFAAAASRYDRVTVELTVMTSVASTFFQAIEAQDRLNVARDNLASAEKILKGLRLELTVGTITALDVAQQETTVAVLNASIPPLQQQLLQSIDTLAILVGKPAEEVNITTGTLADLAEPQVIPGLPSELLARRPDVAEAEAQLMSANASVAVARASFFPSIELTANGGYASTALASLFNPASRVFTLTGELTQPIFEGGQLTGQYAYSKARYAELLADYHKTVISAFSNVEDALVSLQQTALQHERQEVAVAKARRAFDITQRQFHIGTINILTVLNTEAALFTAEDTLVQVKYAHLAALISLYNALGGGWQIA